MANDDLDRERLGQLLRSVREGHSISIRDFAKRLGISHSVITHVELGQDPPSDAVLNGYKREFPEIPRDVEQRFRRRRPLAVPPTKTLERCLIECEPALTIASDGTCTRFDMRLGITALMDGLRNLLIMPVLSRESYEAANFRDLRGGTTFSTKPYPDRPQTHVEVYADFFQPLNSLDKHDISFTFDLPPTVRHWIISSRPSSPYWRLAPSIWLSDHNRINDIELYRVNGYPIELGAVPLYQYAACVRIYPNSNGFIRWDEDKLTPGNLYGVLWRSRSDAVAA
jgi:transcriptional regulator with XRE-family HTH domain